MNNKIKTACAILALAAATSYAGPNLLNSSWDSNGALGEGSDQVITDTPGATYELTFDYQGYGQIPPTIYVFWDYNSPDVTMPFAGLSTTVLQSVDVDLTGSGSDELYLQVEGNGSPGPAGVVMSDFSLVQLPSGVPDASSASALLGVGLLGLAALRRKLS